MTKKEIRTLYKQKRSELTAAERDTMSMQIANQLLQLPIWHHHTYHLFLSIEKLCEINTEYILDILYGKDKQVVVPKMNPETKTLTSIALTDETLLCTNHWGIAEPKSGTIIPPNKIEVVFVPLLAYDLYGNRIGYGGGYYDRFLAECPANTLKIGLSYFAPASDFSNLCHLSDFPLDLTVTPTSVYQFTNLLI